VQHQYSDKFALAEMLTNVTLAAQLNCFEALGMNSSSLARMQGWVQVRTLLLNIMLYSGTCSN